MKKAIYLSGGGARGAYQVGALKAINDIMQPGILPVDILSSVSVGAINAAHLAMHAADFTCAVNKLADLWSSLECNRIFKTSNWALMRSVFRNTASMLLHYQTHSQNYLLDTTPLKELLQTHLDFNQINSNIHRGLLTDFEVAATCYDISETVSFFNSRDPQVAWRNIRHMACLTNIDYQHILASSAFPLFFPSTTIGNLHFGDGGLRLSSPLRAAIKLGAEKILIIGTRKLPSLEATLNRLNHAEISFTKIAGNLLNALFLDSLDKDVELIMKINQTINNTLVTTTTPSLWKNIDILYLRPSIDLAILAENKRSTLPILLRYLLGAFGERGQTGDFLSFLLFEADFCRELIDLGYRDTLKQTAQVIDFFTDKPRSGQLMIINI